MFASVVGLGVELLGDRWFAYSPLTGETSILNDESAAVIEVLATAPGTIESVCDELLTDAGIDRSELVARIGAAWSQLMQAGLIVECPPLNA